ncbi:MAG: hypothetical protein LAT63_01045 [Marinobacter sp.]|nr:hypothetical protein [Marinobacter sp.]
MPTTMTRIVSQAATVTGQTALALIAAHFWALLYQQRGNAADTFMLLLFVGLVLLRFSGPARWRAGMRRFLAHSVVAGVAAAMWLGLGEEGYLWLPPVPETASEDTLTSPREMQMALLFVGCWLLLTLATALAQPLQARFSQRRS